VWRRPAIHGAERRGKPGRRPGDPTAGVRATGERGRDRARRGRAQPGHLGWLRRAWRGRQELRLGHAIRGGDRLQGHDPGHDGFEQRCLADPVRPVRRDLGVRDATTRLIEGGLVAPIDTSILPNYANVFEGLKNLPHNTVDGVNYGVPHGRGPNLLGYNKDVVTPAPTSWDPIWEGGSAYKGKISIYDSSIFIADAALHLMVKRPELGIKDPYQLTQAQFDEAIKLLETLNANEPTYWGLASDQQAAYTSGDVVIGTTWQYQVNLLVADKQPIEAVLPEEGSTGWSDTWMMAKNAAHPNCMLLWMDHMMSAEANAQATVWFGEAPTSPQACQAAEAISPGHCEQMHATDEAYFSKVHYWATPQTDCKDDDAATTCVSQDDWVNAWTTLRGS
jgi:putative spermidine/putrescine transport system substrate-binding protein